MLNASGHSSRVQSRLSGLETVTGDARLNVAFDMSLSLMLGVSPGRKFLAPVRGTSEDYLKHRFQQRAIRAGPFFPSRLVRRRWWLVEILQKKPQFSTLSLDRIDGLVPSTPARTRPSGRASAACPLGPLPQPGCGLGAK